MHKGAKKKLREKGEGKDGGTLGAGISRAALRGERERERVEKGERGEGGSEEKGAREPNRQPACKPLGPLEPQSKTKLYDHRMSDC